MKSEDDPITDDEWLLRRVRVERVRTDQTPLVSPNAFEPRIKGRDRDTDGISLYRAACVGDPSDILATVDPGRRHEYGIVRIPVSLVESLAFSVRSVPVDEIKGHVTIPQLNADDYEADKSRFTSIKYQLAVEASRAENILKRPSEAAGP